MTSRRSSSFAFLAVVWSCAALALPVPAGAGPGGARDDDVRREGTCTGRSETSLRLRADDGRIEVELEIEASRPGSRWSVILLHERRIVFRGALRARDDSVRLRKTVPDWFGSDTVVARATGPRREACRVSATV
jgi:hypothetical protein